MHLYDRVSISESVFTPLIKNEGKYYSGIKFHIHISPIPDSKLVLPIS